MPVTRRGEVILSIASHKAPVPQPTSSHSHRLARRPSLGIRPQQDDSSGPRRAHRRRQSPIHPSVRSPWHESNFALAKILPNFGIGLALSMFASVSLRVRRLHRQEVGGECPRR